MTVRKAFDTLVVGFGTGQRKGLDFLDFHDCDSGSVSVALPLFGQRDLGVVGVGAVEEQGVAQDLD